MNFKIPLFDLNYGTEEEEAVLETIRSKWLSTGPKTTEFENKFASMLSVSHALALSNCTVALHLAMKILDIKDGDEVICPSLTFVATVNAIRYVNAVPVFCDIVGNEDLTLDPAEIEKLITPRTKAIVVMHYAGFPCDMNSIINISKKYNLKIIEDACHAPLSEYEGKKLGSLGDVSCFSFFSNKNMSTGEGGMLATNNEEYFSKAKLLRSHGMTSLSYERSKGHTTSYDVVDLGYNYRMDDIRASLGIVQLQKLETDLKKRAELRAIYIENLKHIENICIPFQSHKGFVSNYIFPIILKNSTAVLREEVRKKLQENGIQTSVHYPAVHKFSIYANGDIKLPKTDYAADNGITLPMYGKLGRDEISFISKCLGRSIS
jgi:dTDP-4-amino-4,6-dideoxygalactose transaminase